MIVNMKSKDITRNKKKINKIGSKLKKSSFIRLNLVKRVKNKICINPVNAIIL